jgi:hypothetical protein
MTQAHDPKFPQTASGALYPKNYVVGIIDDLQEAQQAEQAFKDAGYDAESVRLMEGSEVLDKAQELEENKNWFQRFLSSFQDTTDETGANIYQAAAKQGKQVLHVHANSEQDVDKISALMMRYHAHAVKFFGNWAVSDVPPQSIQDH